MNDTIIAIHQPHYWPWLGLFEKVLVSDVFVVLDDVQFNHRAFQHRALIKNEYGKLRYLTLQATYRKHEARIGEVTLAGNERLAEHQKAIERLYRKAPYWTTYGGKVLSAYGCKHQMLIDINMATLRITLDLFGVTGTRVLMQSDTGISSAKDALIMDLCTHVGGGIYYSGVGAKDYQDESAFRERGIMLRYQDFAHPEYQQLYGDFVSGCAAFDMVLNDRSAARAFIARSLSRKSELKRGVW